MQPRTRVSLQFIKENTLAMSELLCGRQHQELLNSPPWKRESFKVSAKRLKGKKFQTRTYLRPGNASRYHLWNFSILHCLVIYCMRSFGNQGFSSPDALTPLLLSPRFHRRNSLKTIQRHFQRFFCFRETSLTNFCLSVEVKSAGGGKICIADCSFEWPTFYLASR